MSMSVCNHAFTAFVNSHFFSILLFQLRIKEILRANSSVDNVDNIQVKTTVCLLNKLATLATELQRFEHFRHL